MAGLVEVMRLCIYPGLTYDRPSATFQPTIWSHIVRIVWKREREMRWSGIESLSYAKLAVKRIERRGMTRIQKRSVRKESEKRRKRWKRSHRWNYPGTNCSYKFVRIRLHSNVREIWLMPKSKQLVELMLYRPFSSLHHSYLILQWTSELESELQKFTRESIRSLRRSNVGNWKLWFFAT